MIKMEHIFAKRGALLEESVARLQKICVTYQGTRRQEEFAKVYAKLKVWYEDMEVRCARWQEAALTSTDIVVEKRNENYRLKAEVERLTGELNDFAERYDEEHESAICELNNLKDCESTINNDESVPTIQKP